MSQQVATLTVKNNDNTPPSPKKLLTWIKASKEDHIATDKNLSQDV